MVKQLKKHFPLMLILGGMVFFGWNAFAFYEGYNSPDEFKVESVEMEEKIFPEPVEVGIAESKKLYPHIPKTGDKLGEISIPRLNLTVPVYQGTDPEILRQGAGHVVSSALPGESNNSVISGHRDTVFRGLKDIKEHDRLIVTTEAGSFLYKVKKIRIVDADDQTVLTPKPRATLTVTTCYPFYFLGDAPQRYIISADLISPRTERGDFLNYPYLLKDTIR